LIWDFEQNKTAYVASGFPYPWYERRLDTNPTVTVIDSTP
jgi:hypothetical protein